MSRVRGRFLFRLFDFWRLVLVLVGFGIEKVWKVGSIFVFGDGGGLKIYTFFLFASSG